MVDVPPTLSEADSEQRDVAAAQRFLGLAAVLDHSDAPWRAGTVPPLGHWLCFPQHTLQSRLGSDGHPLRATNDVPIPTELSRRMWAGSRINFLHDIPLDARLIQKSSVVSAVPKLGRSGRMMFVTLKHEIWLENGQIAIQEQQDIVYRQAAKGAERALLQPIEDIHPNGIVREIVPDETMLFRFSALTSNSHRIHYDAAYARTVEGYPGLIVHGPLVATLLMDHLLSSQPGARVTSFAFRAIAPAYCGDSLSLQWHEENDDIALIAVGPSGRVMTAAASLE